MGVLLVSILKIRTSVHFVVEIKFSECLLLTFTRNLYEHSLYLQSCISVDFLTISRKFNQQ